MKSRFVNLVMIFTKRVLPQNCMAAEVYAKLIRGRIAAEVEVVMQSTNKKATPRYLRNDLSNNQSRQ